MAFSRAGGDVQDPQYQHHGRDDERQRGDEVHDPAKARHPQVDVDRGGHHDGELDHSGDHRQLHRQPDGAAETRWPARPEYAGAEAGAVVGQAETESSLQRDQEIDAGEAG